MDYTIRQVIEKVSNGQIRIPTFQRGFVWEPEMVAYLMDSIYKGYPFGTLLFWRTKEAFISESPMALSNVLQDYNRNEFHHIYPRSYLTIQHRSDKEINCLANFCFMSRADNNQLGGIAPSIYKSRMATNTDEILGSAFTSDIIFLDNFDNFIDDRATNLWRNASDLIK